MRCENVQPWLGAWQDGEVGAWRCWQIERHVEECTQCRDDVAAFTLLTRRLISADPVAESSLPPIPIPQVYRFDRMRYGVLAATVLLLILTGVYKYHWQIGEGTASTGNPIAVQKHQMPTVALPAGVVGGPLTVRVVQRGTSTVPNTERTGAIKRQIVPRPTRYAHTVVQSRHPLSLVHDLRSRKPRIVSPVVAVTPAVKSREVIEISVKIADPQQVVREYRQEITEAACIAANQQECIYIVATPEPLDAEGNVLPPAPVTDTKQAEEIP